jgi:hypothetical protein
MTSDRAGRCDFSAHGNSPYDHPGIVEKTPQPAGGGGQHKLGLSLSRVRVRRGSSAALDPPSGAWFGVLWTIPPA